jgi:hypothetical protein
MPWCPKCRNEYMESARRCADCDVDLVADLAAHDQTVVAAAAERRLRIEGPPGYLTSLEAWLTQSGVAVRRVEGAVEIPFELADQIESALMKTVEYEREGATIKVIAPRTDQEPAYEVDAALLRLTPAEVAGNSNQNLNQNLPKLAALLGAGTPRQKSFALQTLRALETAGALPLSEFVARLVKGGLRKPLYALAAMLAEAPQPGVATRVAQDLARLDKAGLELALHVLAQLKDRTVARAVLPFLAHDDPDVRADADEVLMCTADRDLGFDAEADEATRARIVKLWREWIDREAGA